MDGLPFHSTLLAALLLGLGGCIAHEKSGDAAASAGDWRGAYEEYGQAVHDGDASPALNAKLEKARRQALEDTTQKGQTCAEAHDWPCALESAQFAVRADPGNADREAFRRLAAQKVALLWVTSARTESAQGRFTRASELLGKALMTSEDAEVTAAAGATKAELLRRLDATVQQLRAQRAYPDAVALLELAARLDEAHQGALARLQHERADWQAQQAQRAAQAGDAAVRLHRFGEAAASYRESLAMLDDPRVTARLGYSTQLEAAETALAQGNTALAVEAFRDAAGSGLDVDGYAAARLQSVQVRPPVTPPPPVSADVPAGIRHPWRTWLTDVSVRLAQEDCALPPHAASFVELEQTGRTLYRGPPQRSLEGRWKPEDVNLSTTERVRVRVWEVASGRPVLVLDAWATPESLSNGSFEASSQRGTWLQLRFSVPVRVGSLR